MTVSGNVKIDGGDKVARSSNSNPSDNTNYKPKINLPRGL
ncbi:hypothetical protein GGD38_002427 [Chitinophagaceae bacterium OAS944]|nr:hypothetical protein [Chitinophagaceae bacterium OAS944]